MTYQEALDALADDDHAWRYRELTAEDHENPRVRDAWRERVVRMATKEPEPEPKPVGAVQPYPSFAQQAWNATKAAGRTASAAIQGKRVFVDQQERDRRLEVCKACEFFDAARQRCTKCGCVSKFKSVLAMEACPVGKW